MEGTPSRPRHGTAARRGGPQQLWLWYLTVCLAATIAAAPYRTATLAVESTLAVLTCFVMWYGPRWYPTAAPVAWKFLFAGQVVIALIAVVAIGYRLRTGHPLPYSSPLILPYVLVFPSFTIGLILRLRQLASLNLRPPRGAGLDTAIVTIGLTTMLWEFVAQPAIGSVHDVPPRTLVLSLTGAVGGTILLIIAARLIILVGTAVRLVMLAASFCALLIGDTFYTASVAIHGAAPNGHVVTVVRTIAHILLGAAALHPGVQSNKLPKTGVGLSRGRLATFVGLALLAPVMVMVRTAWGSDELDQFTDVLVPTGTAAAISVLLIIRLSQIATLASERAAELDRQTAALERSHQALFQARQRFQAMFESAPTGMAQLNHHGRVLAANSALAEFLGRTRASLVGTRMANFVHPEDEGELQGLLVETLRGLGGARMRTLRCNHVEGRQLWADLVMSAVDGLGAARTAIVVIADRTEARLLEVELRHAQKLEGIGRLAAGVAHELNTPIQFIGDNVDFISNAAVQLLSGLDDPVEREYLTEEIPEAVRQTRDGVRRVATIVQALKRFAHPATSVHQEADLNRALLDTLAVARNELKQVADVRTELAELPPVVCSIGDLNQVFLNVLINAAHAVAEVEGEAAITVRSRLAGEDVVIEIADTGPGIPEELREKVFEPFFTTKPVGMGTGQGLALARAVVVDGHGGSIDFSPTPGGGTTFTIQLPIGGRDRRALATALSTEGY